MFGRHLAITGPRQLRNIAARNLHLSGASYQATDPIQQLFVTKIREYANKKKQLKPGEVLVDASPEVIQNYNDSLNRIYKMHNLTKANATAVPDLKFQDKAVQVIELDSVSMENFTPEFPEDKIDLSAENPKVGDLHMRVLGFDPERNAPDDVPSKIAA
ncbi:ATP synthase-coupling factor 6, mitochondrial-like [Saccostrea echinata]|uniref:ATP synthase-coupling factor 6, mitochondrial-like n=1 Tax=Saccostrea echinata TaxID=191078 RepID=UPI002A7F3F80|nr:ATP synthase-coupling factor 6, mitochondrial-like [Saccostrea echinata]